MPDPYVPMLPDELAQISQQHGWEMAIFIGYDPKAGKTNIGSWGKSAAQKNFAALMADKVQQLFGYDKVETHEDFRETPEAKYKEELDRLRKENTELRHLLER